VATNSKSLCSRVRNLPKPQACLRVSQFVAFVFCLAAFLTPVSRAGDAPSWMHALTSTPLPDHDNKTDAVLLYSEDIVTVQGNGKIKHLTRRAFKILRVGGKEHGTAVAYIDAETKILSMKGWCIPAQGKDYEVKEKDAIETSLPGVANGELVSDLRAKLLLIPASDPGNIVGYEIEQEERLYILQEEWLFQSSLPAREARLTLNLPSGWEYNVTWINYPEVKPTSTSPAQSQWVVSDVKAIRAEDDMPPWKGVAGQMLLSLLPPGDSQKKRIPQLGGNGQVGGRPFPEPPRSFTGNQTEGGRAYRQSANHSRQNAGPRLFRAARHPLRRHRTRHWRLAAPSGARHLFPPLWRLQRQGHAAQLYAQGDWG